MKENIYYQYDSSQLPEISLADTAVIEPPYIHKRRMPLEYIIYLVRQGEMFLLEDGVRYHLTPGDFLIWIRIKYMWGKEQHIVNTIIFISIRIHKKTDDK